MTTTSTPAPAAEAAAPTEPQKDVALTAAAPTAPRDTRPSVQFDPDDPVSLYMDSGVFGQLQRVARIMAASNLVPDYLKGKEADCALVVAQAFRWRMDPFAVAQNSFALRGKLGYEGKLIAALVNSHRKLQKNLDYEHSGPKGSRERKVVVIGRLKGETKDRTVEGTVGDWATENENWKKDPDQMLVYRGAREWARRHMPEVLLGIQADEELQPAVTLTRGAGGTFAAPESLSSLVSAPGAVSPESIQAGTVTGQDNAGEPARTTAAPATDTPSAAQAPADAPTGRVVPGSNPPLPVDSARGKFASAVDREQEKRGGQRRIPSE